MMVAEDEALHRAQRSFRAVLDAFARPGVVRQIELAPPRAGVPAGLDAGSMELAGLFVDQATTLCVVDAAPDALAQYMASRTHTRIASLGEAAFAVVPARADEDLATLAVAHARCGTPVAPEKGATVIIGCAKVMPVTLGVTEPSGAACKDVEGSVADSASERPDDPVATLDGSKAGLSVFEVRGPGVAETNHFATDRRAWAVARAQRGDEFPCGIEIVLVDAVGNVVAIPRTSAVSLVRRAS